MENSTHKAEIVNINLTPHPNATTLSIVKVFDYTVCVKTEDWLNKTTGCFIKPDSLVDTTRPEFAFLSKDAKYDANSVPGGIYARIKTKRLRQVVSYGLLIPAPEGSKVGDNVADQLGILHYEPFVGEKSDGEATKGPSLYAPNYDVDAFQRYAKQVFINDEPCYITEKVHGANSRYVYKDGVLHCGSKKEWKKEFIKDNTSEAELRNMWWKALYNHPELMEWLKNHENFVVYGEVCGQVKGYNYGSKQGKVKILVFDILAPDGTWLSPEPARLAAPELTWVPTLSRDMPFNFDKLVELASGNTLVPGGNHIREGIVISPIVERYHDAVGRVKLKIVSPEF